MANNPLHQYFRAPKKYIQIPSQGKLYSAEVLDMPETGEIPVMAMTARDEMFMKNPDALLNGEAVASVIQSCIPVVKQPRQLVGPDVDTMLVAIQGATYGDDVEIQADCPKCGTETPGVASIDQALQTMNFLPDDPHVTLDSGLIIRLKPITYETNVKAGLASFQSTRSLQAIAEIQDELEQIQAFNISYRQMAELNFLILIDSVHSIQGKDSQGEDFIVQDRASIQEFLENCENSVGASISKAVESMADTGVNKIAKLQCPNCEHVFETNMSFDPVNFFTAS